jgi:methylmalonyl-CoA mutase
MAAAMIPEPARDGSTPSLLAEFPPVTLEAWHAEVLRLLKGRPFEKVMPTETPEGLTLKPIYTAADLADLPQVKSLPGEVPFARGATAAGPRREGWAIAQELPFPKCVTFHEELRRALAHGQTAVHLVLDAAARAGCDPDQAPVGDVGAGGTSVATVGDLHAAFRDIDVASLPILVRPGAAGLPFLGLMLAHLQARGVAPGALRGSLGADPLAELAGAGTLPVAIEALYDEIAVMTRWAQAEAPELRTLSANGHVYHDGGATAVEELAAVMATAIEHLRQAERRGIDAATLAERIQFGFSIGTGFFMEIAKLRAARMIWGRILKECGARDAARSMQIHARTSRLSQTALDPHVNILRATTEAFAAIAGGCDSLHVAPFDDAQGLPGDLSLRLARNTQIVLREECHLDAVIDPAGGSWFVESLTAELARAAWARIQEIERAGGMLAALLAGKPQRVVAEQGARRAARIAGRQEILVGVNQYPNAGERPIERRLPDAAAIHAARAAELARHRAATPPAQRTAALERVRSAGRAAGPGQVHPCDPESAAAFVAALRDAALTGATLGELAAAARSPRSAPARSRRDVAARVTPIAACRGAEAFEALRAAVTAWRARAGRDPQVFLANIGPVGEYMPRLDFARSFFEIGGFAVAADDWFETSARASAAALASGASVVVIVAPDAVYPNVVPELAAALKSGARGSGAHESAGAESGAQERAAGAPMIMLAGYPRDQVEALRAAGVEEFIHVKSDALEVLKSAARILGVTR